MSTTYTAIITGATRGIGLAILHRFLRGGFSVAFCGTNQIKVDQLFAELRETYPNANIAGFQADLGTSEAAKTFAEKALAAMGGCHVLVNNAGTFLPGSVLSEDEGTLEKLLDVNVGSAYHVSRGVIPAMISKPRAHVFNMCSIASKVAYVNGGSYCISKFALLGLTKLLREELKSHHICVTAVLPGATLTDSWAGTDLPVSRFIKPEDIAEHVFNAWKLNQTSCAEELLIRPLEGDI
jgi:NAD(P)-dependent dehydrogenase (short-subunit alcohol dehydrogenase family)